MRVVLLLVTLVLAGCIAPPAVDEPSTAAAGSAALAVVEDPAGDALERGTGAVPEPAAAHFDLLAVSFDAETETSLVLALTLAGLSDTLAELESPVTGQHRVAVYTVCFSPDAEALERCVTAQAANAGSGPVLHAWVTVLDHDCNEWAACIASVPVRLEPGAPARLVFEVPKEIAGHGGATTVGLVSASVLWSEINPLSPVWHTALSVNTPVAGTPAENYHQHYSGGDVGDVPDEIPQSPVDVAFSTAPPVFGDGRLLALTPGNLYGAGSRFDRPDLDILAVDLREEGDQLVVRWTVAELAGEPTEDVLYIVEIGIAGKEVWEVGYIREPQNGAYGYAGHCISYECAGDMGGNHSEHDMSLQFSMPAEATIIPGAPGAIEVRVPLATFPSIVAGDRTNLVQATSMATAASVWIGRYGDDPRADWHQMSFVDFALGGVPYVFTGGNAPGASHHDERRMPTPPVVLRAR